LTEWKDPQVICEVCKFYEVVNHEETPYHIRNLDYKQRRENILKIFHKVKLKKMIKLAQSLPCAEDEEDEELIEQITLNAFNHVSTITDYSSGASMNCIDTLWALITELKLK